MGGLRPIVAGLVALVAARSLGAESWGPYGAWNVRRTVAIPPADKNQPTLPQADCCYVSFPTAGLMQPEGQDLRVTVDGTQAPFKIIDIEFGGVVGLVAPVTSAAQEMQVYYGNSAARASDRNWSPQRGLWLETRKYQGGECRTVAGIRQAWAKGERLGRGPVGQIFHGFNPFGPSDNYLSLYTGWVYLPKDTPVHFAVVADDIGFLLVDDKLVASKPNWGPMPRHRHFAGDPVSLKQGLHTVQMYHVEATGGQAAGAAWWMPGMRRGEKYLHYQIIPPQSFAPLRYGRLVDYEVQGQPVAADFAALNDGDVLLDDKELIVRYVFRDQSRPAPRALQCQPLWEFGDGTSTESRDPSHIYLEEGDYTVTLTLRHGERAYKVSQQIRVGPGWERAVRRQWDKLEHYHPILKDYQFDKMPSDHLVVAARIFEELEKPEEIIATCSALHRRGGELDDATFVHHCLLLGRYSREVEGKAKEALQVFTDAERRTKDVATKARLANEKGDVRYYFLGDLDGAIEEYTRTLTELAKAEGPQVRLAQIRVGDVYRTKGDYTAALKAYERAAEMPIHTRSELVESARRGSFPHTVEDYTQRKLFQEAHDALNEWDWEFPTDKLVGYSSLLRARLALAEGKKDEAVKQAEELIRVSHDSEYADDLLLFLADLHLGDSQLDKALAAIDRLLKDFPASELQEPARLKRMTIHLRQAKYNDVASEGLALAKANEDSENAPKALLLAATAQVRLKKNDEAARTLERLTQKYPTTAEATEGLRILKELRRP